MGIISLEIVEKEFKTKGKIKRIIVFSQYRETVTKICKTLNTIKGVNARVFVGQAKKRGVGITQKEQVEILENFKTGGFNVLVATSVAEEGLDVPQVDLVVFYEPIASGIRHIQRKGRTGRQKEGKVIVLITKHTRDEIYRWSSHRKQKKMKRILPLS